MASQPRSVVSPWAMVLAHCLDQDGWPVYDVPHLP